MRISITVRVALLAALLAFAANLAAMGFVYWRTHNDDAERLRRQVVEESLVLSQVYDSGGRPALARAIADTLREGDPQYLAAVVDARGNGRAGNVAAVLQPDYSLRSGYRTGVVRLRGRSVPIEAGLLLQEIGGGDWLLSGRGFGERLALQRTLERSLLLGSILSVLLGLLCGAVIARYVGRRVDSIASVADRITGGDLAQRVPLSGSGDAFDALAGQINAMLDRIAALMGELRMLTDCLAHDLRSPVGRLRARVDAAVGAGEEERDALLAGVVLEADALMRILTTILEIGRSEAMTARNQFAWLEPGELIDELADMYEPLVEDAGAALRVDKAEPLQSCFGHRQLLAQALTNLVDNALKYAAGGGEIALFAHMEGGSLRLGVADRGPGIPAAEQAEARRRFGRLDTSRSTAGAGLGLALAEAVAHLHQGELELGDNAPGLRAALAFPASPSAKPGRG
ncbi:MAG TPA: HAMP domain-containing sensor histidine kinase [Allosphingosinicella sp.]|jgi:signal transduction histidine kinase